MVRFVCRVCMLLLLVSCSFSKKGGLVVPRKILANADGAGGTWGGLAGTTRRCCILVVVIRERDGTVKVVRVPVVAVILSC